MVEEFLHLSQGNRTVDQYAAKFNELLPFAGSLADTEEKKTLRFCRGFKQSLKIATAGLIGGVLEISSEDGPAGRDDRERERQLQDQGLEMVLQQVENTIEEVFERRWTNTEVPAIRSTPAGGGRGQTVWRGRGYGQTQR